ncbi:MAG TPA: tRNA adenosine(34) deaminase TadA [Bacillota bacterium]
MNLTFNATQSQLDRFFMEQALIEAEKAAQNGEVPVGAVLVYETKIIARAFNLRETSGDPTAHAEILVLRQGASLRKHWRLSGTILYSTLEPCPMCAGALVQARVGKLVYGAADPKTGAAGSLINLVQDERLNHRLEVTKGVLAEDCAKLLKEFFRERR